MPEFVDHHVRDLRLGVSVAGGQTAGTHSEIPDNLEKLWVVVSERRDS